MNPEIIAAAKNLQQCRKHVARFEDIMNATKGKALAAYHKAYKRRAHWMTACYQAEQELVAVVMDAVFCPPAEPAQLAPEADFNFMDAIRAQAAEFGLEILSVEVDGVLGPVSMVDDTGFAAQAVRLFTDEILAQIEDSTKGQK